MRALVSGIAIVSMKKYDFRRRSYCWNIFVHSRDSFYLSFYRVKVVMDTWSNSWISSWTGVQLVTTRNLDLDMMRAQLSFGLSRLTEGG